ncbi:MAG: hypothetical protein MHM6MM_002264 [Cercozoa sp. M6MM]
MPRSRVAFSCLSVSSKPNLLRVSLASQREDICAKFGFAPKDEDESGLGSRRQSTAASRRTRSSRRRSTVMSHPVCPNALTGEQPKIYRFGRIEASDLVDEFSVASAITAAFEYDFDKVHFGDFTPMSKVELSASVDPAAIPLSFKLNTAREEALLEFVEGFRRHFVTLWPEKQVPLLVVRNEFGQQKFICTCVRPHRLQWAEISKLQPCANFVSDFFQFMPLQRPRRFPTVVPSLTSLSAIRNGDCLDLAVVLVSLLLGAGHDAKVVLGYADVRSTHGNVEHMSPGQVGTDIMDSSKWSWDFLDEYSDLADENVDEFEQEKRVSATDSHYPGDSEVEHIKHIVRQTWENSASSSKQQLFESQYERFLADEKASEAAAERDAQREARERKRFHVHDRLQGKRAHAWVVVKQRDEEGHTAVLFIEPSTGQIRSNTELQRDRCYLGVLQVFDHENVWVNISPNAVVHQDGVRSENVAKIAWDFEDKANWQAVLLDDPATNGFRSEEALKADFGDSASKESTGEKELEEHKGLRTRVTVMRECEVETPDDVKMVDETFEVRELYSNRTDGLLQRVIDLDVLVIRERFSGSSQSKASSDLSPFTEELLDLTPRPCALRVRYRSFRLKIGTETRPLAPNRTLCTAERSALHPTICARWIKAPTCVSLKLKGSFEATLPGIAAWFDENCDLVARHKWYWRNLRSDALVRRSEFPRLRVDEFFENRADRLHHRVILAPDVLPKQRHDSKIRYNAEEELIPARTTTKGLTTTLGSPEEIEISQVLEYFRAPRCKFTDTGALPSRLNVDQ